MARARNIKPGFFKNEDLGTADPFVSLLFAGLWTLADKAGILEDRPLRIRAELFPYRENFDINGYLTVLVSLHLIHRYTVDELRLIQVVNFSKHQNPHHTEKASEYPEYSTACQNSVIQPLFNGATPADSLIPDSLIPDSLSLDSAAKPPAQEAPIDTSEDGFSDFWSAYPKRPGASKADSLKAWKTRIKEGAPPESLIKGAVAYEEYCRTSSIEPRFIKQPATFLGPGRHFEADWTPSIPQENEKSAKDSAFLRSIGFGKSPESHLLQIEEAPQ